MLPRSLLCLLVGFAVCSAQQQFQQFYQPQFQPQQQFQYWQPQYDQQQPQFSQQPQFVPQPQQFQSAPLQYQPQAQAQFSQGPPVYQPQFQPQPQSQQIQTNYQPQQSFPPQFQPQPQNFQPQQPIFQQQVNQSPRIAPAAQPQFQQPVFQSQPAVFREQPVIYEQTVKIPFKPVQRPPPPQVVQINTAPVQPQPQIIQIAAPPPPEKFVPYIADIFSGPSNQKPPVITVISPDSSLPPGTYIAEEIVVDGNHPSFIENIEKFQPTLVREGQVQTKQPSFVPQPQAKLKAPEISIVPHQRPRPPPAQVRPSPRPAPKKVTITTPPTSNLIAGADSPNDVFLGCCQRRKVFKACERICNFDILNKKTLTGMFLGTDPCPQSHGLDLLQCGASNEDHTQCCIENEVHKTSAGKKCLGFCNMKPGVSFQADVSMLPCWGVLNDIKDCFKGYIEDKL